jgi:hypothetical protein
MMAQKRHDDWTLRGALVGDVKRQRYGSALDQISHIQVEMPETSITYPCEIHIQARLVVDETELACMVVGAGIAARQRDISL